MRSKLQPNDGANNKNDNYDQIIPYVYKPGKILFVEFFKLVLHQLKTNK